MRLLKMPKKSAYNFSSRICASCLIILHLVTFGPLKDAFAFSAQSVSFKLSTGTTNEGGSSRNAASAKLWQDAIGESSVGGTQSASFILNSGFIPLIQSNPPVLTQEIPFQTWAINTAKNSAFDLDDYFISPDNYALTFSVTGSSKINLAIDPVSHVVSFSQAVDWFGTEKIYFTATDTEGNTIQSNEVVLQVANSSGQPNKPVIVDTKLAPAAVKKGDLVTLTVQAYDTNNQDLTFSYSDFFTETRHWKDGNFCYSEATWQTSAFSTGHYTTRVTVSDGALTDTSSVIVNVGNFNHPPVLDNLPDITVNEGDLVVIIPHATDSDNDPMVFYYSAPFDTQGKWLTGYNDSGTRNIQVTASDGIDTVTKAAKVTINNTNRAPQVTLTLSSYTVRPNEQVNILLSATDPDGDSMSYVLKKDGSTIGEGGLTKNVSSTVSFSNIANHTISATVTDSGGLSTTDSKGVDVADPNANRDSINPVMGDFNGDALTDLGLHNSDTGTWEICISDKGTFRNAITWLTNFGTSRDWWPIGGDFNGDGKTDIGIYNNTTGELKIALSSGASFSVSGTWLTFPNASYSWQPFTGNFNGDKYTDIAFYNKDTAEVKVALGTGSGFGAPISWLTGLGTDYIALAGDFNGDGLSDLGLFKKTSGEFKVAFSNTKAFVDGSSWISGYAVDKDALISDFNNDGLADIGYWNKTNGAWHYAISTGASFVDKGAWLNSFGQSSDESATTGDFDGNGITDSACFDKDQLGINRWATRLSTDKLSDLLTEIDNGIGGKTQVVYTYAAQNDNSNLPFPVYVASSISLVNTFPADRSASYTQSFTFSGGYYDTAEREFRGFAKVKALDPITGNYSQTYFYQGKSGEDGALKGQIQKIVSFDGNARKISETNNTYEVKKSGPADSLLGFPSLAEQATTVWEENGTALATDNKFTYDNIGNLVVELSAGDISVSGDEKSTATTYAQAYEVGPPQSVGGQGFNRPLETALKDKDDQVVSKKNFEYDNQGNLIVERIAHSVERIVETTPMIISAQYAYDSFGNLTSTTNAKGATVTTDYETTFYAYPEKVTNSLGQSITYEYNPKFGAVTKVTDPNGNISSTTYDSLGRVLQVKNAYNQVVSAYAYPDFNTKISTNAVGLSSTEYIDGLGRKYKAISFGEDGSSSRQVASETFYNNRGQVQAENLPHYINEDPGQISYTRYDYDIRGRVIKTTADFPGSSKDAFALVSYINPLYAETTDPQGHRKASRKNVWGNVVEVIEFISGGVTHTYYEYDIQNNLTKTTDNQGNITQIFYDSAGRKLKMIDPDMGTWAYEYDILGNLIKQTDAKGQVLQFEYDTLNRLTVKRGLSPQGTVPIILATYFYDDSAKDNCLGRLSKITDQSGSTEFFYDKLGREIKSVKGLSSQGTAPSQYYTVEREYDILDRLTKLTYPDGEAVNYAYDSNSGLLETVQGMSPQGTVPYVKDISYNAKGQIKLIKYGNNTQTDYTYGQDLRLSRIYTQGLSPQGTVPAQDLNYIFDKNGNVTTLTDNLRSNIRTYGYDELNRLKAATNVPAPGGGYTNFNYQYDSIGNMTYKSDLGVMTYGGVPSPSAGEGARLPHALTNAGGYSYQYDSNGNMTVGKNKTLEYDAENRLTKVNELGAITNFVYDGDGGRVMKTLIPLPSREGPGEGVISTTYIGSLFEIERLADSGERIVKHIFAGSNRICSIERGLSPQGTVPEIYYYHSDHLGSSSIITNQSGQQVQHCEYTPYGTLARNEGSDIVKHKFTGKELDSTGLYFYGARYYDPEIGRFITADTIVQAPYNPQTLNRYSYCGNNPINYTDPTGHFFWFGIIIGAILGAISSAINHQPIWQGALMGAVGGALVGVGGAAAYSLWGPAWAFVGAAAGGAVSGAINAAVSGGNIGYSALIGAVGAGVGYGVGYGVGQAAGPFWGAVGGGLAGGVAGGGIGAELGGGNFWQGAGMGAAYGVVGALAGYGAAKGAGDSNTQKATRQLEVDKKPANIVNRANSNLKPGMMRRFVSEREYVEILDKGYVSSTNKEGTYWTPNNIINPGEAQTFLRLSGPSRYYAVDVPAENFNYAYQQIVVQGVSGGPVTEVITEYGVQISVRGGRAVDFRTMTETTFVYGDNN